jgi:hypothetical protein
VRNGFIIVTFMTVNEEKNEKKSLFQVRYEFSPLTFNLVAYLSIKKQGGALILQRALRGWGAGGFSKNLPRLFL